MKSYATVLPHLALKSALAIMILGGCTVGPDYVPPQSELGPFHNLPDVAKQETRSVPPFDRWWIGFNDAALVTIIHRALDQNLDLAASIARVLQTRAVVAGSSAQFLPTVDLGGSAVATHRSLRDQLGTIASGFPTYRRDIQEYAVGPAASWELDFFGGLRRAEAAARHQSSAMMSDQMATRVSVAADAADAYLQIRGYQARLTVAERQVEIDERLLKLVRHRYQAGIAQGREIAQADALLRQARASIPPLRIALEQQMNRLDVLMGDQPGSYAHNLEPVQAVPSIPPIPSAEQPVDMLRRRPDIIAAERRLAASSERIGAALSDYYPKISLVGALGFDSLKGTRLFTSQAFQASGGGALRWRIFDFGKIDAEVVQARGANAEALALYRRAVLRAAEDVENALQMLAQIQIHVTELQDQVNSLISARDLSEQAYRAGSIALLDVLDADRQLLMAQDQLHANRANAARAAVGVYRALGGGWDSQIPY